MNDVSKTIGWADKSFNPITGCLHGCFYCYAKRLFHRFHKSFEPTFYPERLEELKKIKKPAKIFVCSVSDLFAPWTKPQWRYVVLREIYKPEYNHLTFQLLTKNPENIRLGPKENIWIGTTITDKKEMVNWNNLNNNYSGIKFISFEPLLGEVHIPPYQRPDWVIVGKLTGSKKVKLEKEWVLSLIRDCWVNKIPIFCKNNLIPIIEERYVKENQKFPR